MELSETSPPKLAPTPDDSAYALEESPNSLLVAPRKRGTFDAAYEDARNERGGAVGEDYPSPTTVLLEHHADRPPSRAPLEFAPFVALGNVAASWCVPKPAVLLLSNYPSDLPRRTGRDLRGFAEIFRCSPG